jgi:starvation-inducible outer membrane lipoprotein
MHTSGFACLTLALSLSACATPLQLKGNFATLSPIQASNEEFVGSDIRWGGAVVGERLTDAGECMEIASYSLDRFTFRPMQPVTQAPMRFLACGDQLSSKTILDTSGTVTLTGKIEPSKIYQVERSACVRTATNRNAIYAGTVHAINNDMCVISLPIVKIAGIYTWPRWTQPPLPINNPPFQGMAR